jgi:hypothetical protein
MPPYSLVVVPVGGGSSVGTVEAASNVRPVWEHNGIETLDFDVNTVDPDAALLEPTQVEVQLWYDNGVTPKCKWWGPVWRRDLQGNTTHIQCRGLQSYFEKVQIGPVIHENLTDPDHQDPALAAYTAGGTVTMTSDTTIVRKGTRSMKLMSSAAGLDNFASQQFTITAGSQAVAVFVRSRFYIEAVGGSYLGPAYKERGLFVERIESAVVQQAVWTPITNGAPRNQWVRIVAPPVFVPAGHTQTIEVRWYSVGGPIYWATSTGREEESVGAGTANSYADVNVILANTLAYAQDPAWNKRNFNIAGPAGTFGLDLLRQFQFYNHGMVWPVAVQPLIDAGICDVAMVWNETTPTTRTLQTYTHKGSSSGVTLTFPPGNADLSSYTEDGTAVAGAVTMLPQGMDAEVTLGQSYPVVDDVAYAVDTAANGGVTFDEVVSALPESTLDMMDGQAATELARRKELVDVPVLLTSASAWWASGATTGDTVVVNGSFGWVSESSVTRRVMSVALLPEKNLVAVGVA